MNKAEITVTVGEADIRFSVSDADYNGFINNMNPNDKVKPAHNFLVSTVNKDDKAALMVHLKAKGGGAIAMQIAGLVIQEFQPDIEITVKKPEAAAMQSAEMDT